jgi:hypothetical protein
MTGKEIVARNRQSATVDLLVIAVITVDQSVGCSGRVDSIGLL